jgi:hypothetical protein
MWQRLASNWALLGSVVMACFGILASMIMFGVSYSSATDVPLNKRMLGWLLMSCWASSPYIAAILATYLFAVQRATGMVLLSGTVLMTGCALYVFVTVILRQNDGQAGFALVVMPVIQWLMLIVVGFVCAAIALYARLSDHSS